MPLFTGVGARIRDRLLALGYQQANGKPDVRRFCREKSYDDALFYFWLRDMNTPVKERERLAADLGISEAELLFGVVPKAQPGKARRRRSPAEVLLVLGLGLGAALWPSGSVSGSGQTPLQVSGTTDKSDWVDYDNRRRFWNVFRYFWSFRFGPAYAF